MGVIAHKSLIVTGFISMAFGEDADQFTSAYNKAKELFAVDELGEKVNLVSEILDSRCNDYKTFIIVPDGSKEGWGTSDFFDKQMDMMISHLKSDKCVFKDKSSMLDWVLIEYGETGRRILNSNCRNKY